MLDLVKAVINCRHPLIRFPAKKILPDQGISKLSNIENNHVKNLTGSLRWIVANSVKCRNHMPSGAPPLRSSNSGSWPSLLNLKMSLNLTLTSLILRLRKTASLTLLAALIFGILKPLLCKIAFVSCRLAFRLRIACYKNW